MDQPETTNESQWTEEQTKVFASLGMTPEVASQTLEKMNYNRKDKRLEKGVCICGHGGSRHNFVQTLGKVVCRVNVRTCHCARFVPILKPSTLLPFARVSEGNGVDHALFRGIIGLMESGGSFTWIDGKHHCFNCGTDDDTIHPVIVDSDGVPATPHKDILFDRIDILLCASCDTHLQTYGKVPKVEE